jgi:hypothetical protein
MELRRVPVRGGRTDLLRRGIAVMTWQHVMTTAPRGHQAPAAARQARAAVPMTRRVVRSRRRAAGRTIVA